MSILNVLSWLFVTFLVLLPFSASRLSFFIKSAFICWFLAAILSYIFLANARKKTKRLLEKSKKEEDALRNATSSPITEIQPIKAQLKNKKARKGFFFGYTFLR